MTRGGEAPLTGALTCAVDVGGTHVRVALCTPEGRIVRKAKVPTDRDGGGPAIVRYVTETAAAFATHASEPVAACGIGFCGPVDFAKQTTLRSLHVGGWEGVPLARLLSNALGVPAILDNDGNTGALGEATYGVARGRENVVYMTLSTGVAGGLVLGGRIYRGSRNLAGELGHMKVLPNTSDSPRCHCGRRGCLESVCSIDGIRALCERMLGRSLSPRELFDAAEAGDEPAGAVADEIAGHLARALASLIHILSPDLVVIGGGIARAGAALFEPLYMALRSELLAAYDPRAIVVPAGLGDDSGLLGALALARTIESTANPVAVRSSPSHHLNTH